MTCDNDGDEILKEEEIEDLIHKIEGIQGVDLNDELIRKKIVECGASLNGTSITVDAYPNQTTRYHDSHIHISHTLL